MRNRVKSNIKGKMVIRWHQVWRSKPVRCVVLIVSSKNENGPSTRTVSSNRALWDAEFSQDGRLWAAAGSDGQVHVYATDDDPEEKPYYSNLCTLRNHTDRVAGIALDPGGSLLASASFWNIHKLRVTTL